MNEKPQYHLKSKIINNFVKLCFISFFLLFVHDSFGQTITWERIYNGTGNNSDGFRSIGKADGDNIYAAGYTFLTGSLSSKRLYVVKLNSYGDTLWAKVFGNSGSDIECITSSNDGGCVFSGYWGDSSFVIKLNSGGNIVWQKKYMQGSTFYLYDIKKTNDGGYIACGRYDDANFNGYILKIDSVGNLQWQRMYPAQFFKVFHSVEIAHDNGYVLVGTVNNFQSENGKGFITKINDLGDTIWNKTFSIDTQTSAEKIVKVNSGYIIGGTVRWRINLSHTRMYFYRVDLNCDSVYTKILDSPKDEYLYDLKVINENKYVLAGYIDSTTANILSGKIWITDSLGIILKQKTLPSPDYIVLYSILPLPNGDLVIAGEADMNINPYNDAYAVRLDSNLNYVPIGLNNISTLLPNEIMLYPNYPNPFNPETRIRFDINTSGEVTIVVTDITGRLVEILVDQFLKAGKYEVNWQSGKISSGVYFCTIRTKNQNRTIKMLYLK